MNQIVIKALIFGAGIVSGALGSALVLKGKYEKKSDKEIAELEAYYKEKYGCETDFNAAQTAPEKAEEPEIVRRVNTSEKGLSIKEQIEKYKHDYTSHYQRQQTVDPAEEEHPTDDEETNMIGEEYSEERALGEALTRERRIRREPKIIKAEEFGQDYDMQTVTLLYYTEDSVLADEDENVYEDLDEVSSMIGNALTKYDFKNSDETARYVRNYNYGVDYEILKVDGSFSNLVKEGAR